MPQVGEASFYITTATRDRAAIRVIIPEPGSIAWQLRL